MPTYRWPRGSRRNWAVGIITSGAAMTAKPVALNVLADGLGPTRSVQNAATPRFKDEPTSCGSRPMSGTARKSLNVYAGCRLVIIAILCSAEFLDFRVHPYTLEVIMVDEYPEVAVWVVGLRAVAAFAQA